ncbi:hypothetical protein OsJ_06000 [Oryza sativa Japonica Group]|uniref:DUF4371 domain-containing protein n=1 Tax=Oryza sativa subsp. japonica TaxID=39947 RepID=B9F4G1_ORYSJ|nr:hypothetical protein OsJ_06000 [Oryza sativa Japonica Group]
MTPWNTDSDSDSDTRKKPIWRTYIFEFLSSHLLQPLAPASTCAQVLDQQLAPRHGSRHPAPPSLRDLNADPPAEDDDHIVHLHGEPLPQPPYFPEPKPPPTSTVVEAVAVAVVVAAAAASPATCHYIWRLIQAIKPLLTIGQRNNRQEVNDLNWKEEIKYDPGLRKPIDAYHPNLRDRIQSEDAKKAYFTRLNGSISVARRLLKQGLPFRGYDESKDSYNKGNFLEFHDMLLEHDHALGKAVASPLDPAPPSLRDLNADPPAEDDDHIVHLHGEPLPQPPYFPEPNAAADLDGGLDGDAEASFPGSNPEADGRELDGDLEQDHSLFMFLDPGEVRCRKRLRASEEDDVDVGDARGAPGRCYDDDVAEDGRSTQSRYSWRPRNADDQSYTHDDDTPAAQEISGEQIAADDTYYDSYYYMDGEYGGAYDEEEHQQDDMAAADFHDGNQLSPEHQRVLYRLFGEADGSTRQEEQEAAAQGSGGEHVPPEEDSYEAAAVLAGDDVDEEQLQRQEQVDMTDGTDETF